MRVNLSNKFLIVNNLIINKKSSKSYKINNKLLFILRNILNNNSCENKLYNKVFDYFFSEGILEISDIDYEPFVKLTKLNTNRLFIQLTKKCNLYCKHCFLSSTTNDKLIFGFDDIKKIIEDAIENGIYEIDFTGGEISTVVWLKDLIDYLDRKPIIYSFFSNLVITDKVLLNKMCSAVGLSQVITSIDFYDENKHDVFRGKKGAFNITLNNIKLLLNNGVRVSVNTMILKDNYDELTQIVDLIYGIGATSCFDIVVNKGRAKNIKNIDENIITDLDQIKFLSEYIERKYNKRIGMYVNSECGVGEKLIYLDYKARFQLCPGLTENDNSEFYLGNSILEAVYNRDKFDLICDNTNCELHNVCSYGCREKAYLYTGSINKEDFCTCYLMKKWSFNE